MEVLQNSLYLPTLLTNLRRKDQIGEEAVNELLGHDKGEAIQKLLDLLKSKDPPGDRSMSDALLETNPDVAERVGLASLPAAADCQNSSEHSHIVKSYHAILKISTNRHIHADESLLRHSRNKYSAFV
uniref:Uncharacterized protein LOC111108789 n=1 Tax=Crassostrea virginica TaxID=6565 RepID=A0A8B8BAY0_CRAVI|nr:uncharacterized protein LOC111108789 [Crassostrea virginica]